MRACGALPRPRPSGALATISYRLRTIAPAKRPAHRARQKEAPEGFGVLGAKTRADRGQFHFVGLCGGGPAEPQALGGWGAEYPGSALQTGATNSVYMEGVWGASRTYLGQ
jgi:hypothetical protein